MIVNSTENSVASSIIKKPTKRSGLDFAKFLYNLGKTDKHSKEIEVKTQNKASSKNPKVDYKPIRQAWQPHSTLHSTLQSNPIQKTSINNASRQLNTNQKVPILDIPAHFVDSKIDDFKEVINSSNDLFKKASQDKIQYNSLTNNDIKNSNKLVNKDIIPVAQISQKDKDVSKNKEEQNNKHSQLQLTNTQITNNDPKELESRDLKQPKIDDASSLDSDLIKPTTNEGNKNIDDIKDPNESKKNTKIESKAPQIQKDQQDISKETKNNDTPSDSNEALINNFLKNDTPKFSTLKDNEVKLSLKDTLKYGTFKAFDALSLLKPSDGKKLSDLIKKADELALNLTKIQHKKEDSKTDNKKPLDLKNVDLKTKIESTKDVPQKQETKDINNQQSNKEENETKNIAKVDNKILDSKPHDKEDMNNKDNKQDNLQNQKKDTKDALKSPQKQEVTQNSNQQNNTNLDSKSMQKEINNDLKNMTQQDSNTSKDTDFKPATFKPSNKNEIKNDSDTKQINNDKNIDSINIDNTKNNQTQSNSALKNTFNDFARTLKQEIINYKPPLSKLTLELNPANLGNIEVNITHQGKNIQLQLNGSQNTINLFIQNQSDLRSALSQIGYDNVTMSFSNGSQMGFSDSKGNWNFKHLDREIHNIDDDVDHEVANLEMTLVNNYA